MEVFSLSAPKSRYVMFMFLVSLFMLMNAAYAEENPKADIKLISNLDSVNKNADLIVGVQFKLPKGWTTFWRTPGEVGYGAQFNWEGSSNIKSFEVFWPYPTREHIFDFYANVYENEVLFPIKIIPDNQLKPVSIKLSVDYLLCQAGACIPLQQNLSLYLPVGAAKSGKNSALIRQAMEKIPEPENTDKLFINDLTLAQLKDDSATLSFKANAQEGFNNASVFIEGPKELSFGIPKLSRIDDTSACYIIDIEKNDAKQTHLTMAEILKNPLTITFVNKDKAISISRITLPKTKSGAINSISENGITGVQDKEHSIIFTLIFAFLGGLILNLMPRQFIIEQTHRTK